MPFLRLTLHQLYTFPTIFFLQVCSYNFSCQSHTFPPFFLPGLYFLTGFNNFQTFDPFPTHLLLLYTFSHHFYPFYPLSDNLFTFSPSIIFFLPVGSMFSVYCSGKESIHLLLKQNRTEEKKQIKPGKSAYFIDMDIDKAKPKTEAPRRCTSSVMCKLYNLCNLCSCTSTKIPQTLKCTFLLRIQTFPIQEYLVCDESKMWTSFS